MKENLNKDIKMEDIDGNVSLIKLLLTPIELFVFKFFLIKGKPLNIRKIYSSSIGIIFSFCLMPTPEKWEGYKAYKTFYKNLEGANYGSFILLSDLEKKESISFISKVKNETDLVNKEIEQLLKNKIKFPSYEKLKKVVDNFIKKGILVKIEKTNLYTMNPKIYLQFSKNKKEILEL